jgi:hypothetical protein
MEIFNASIAEVADTFLHPGYMSAYVEVTAPVSMTAAIVPVDKEPVMQVDMAQALKLTEALREPAGVVSGSMAPPVDGFPVFAVVLVATAALLAVWMAHALRMHRGSPRLLGVLASAALLAVGACGQESPPEGTGPPGSASAPRVSRAVEMAPDVPFADPRLATQAILHGLISDALACSLAPEIESLATVRAQIGLPGANKTAGMRWAVANFEDDGWGRRFRFRVLAKDRFEVTSAAEDGAFDTGDDISLEVRRAGSYTWPSQLRGFFLRRDRGDVGISFHRCGPEGARKGWINPSVLTARGLRSDALFGVIQARDFPAPKRDAMDKRLASHVADDRKDALILMVFDPKDIGKPVLRKIHVLDW